MRERTKRWDCRWWQCRGDRIKLAVRRPLSFFVCFLWLSLFEPVYFALSRSGSFSRSLPRVSADCNWHTDSISHTHISRKINTFDSLQDNNRALAATSRSNTLLELRPEGKRHKGGNGEKRGGSEPQDAPTVAHAAPYSYALLLSYIFRYILTLINAAKCYISRTDNCSLKLNSQRLIQEGSVKNDSDI